MVGHSETHHRNDDLGPRVVRLAHWTATKPKEDGDDQDRQRPVDELGGRSEEDSPVLPIPVTEGARVGALEFFLLRAVLRSSSLRLRMEHAEEDQSKRQSVSFPKQPYRETVKQRGERLQLDVQRCRRPVEGVALVSAVARLAALPHPRSRALNETFSLLLLGLVRLEPVVEA